MKTYHRDTKTQRKDEDFSALQNLSLFSCEEDLSCKSGPTRDQAVVFSRGISVLWV